MQETCESMTLSTVEEPNRHTSDVMRRQEFIRKYEPCSMHPKLKHIYSIHSEKHLIKTMFKGLNLKLTVVVALRATYGCR